MGAGFFYFPVVDEDYPVGVLYGGQSVGDEYGRPALRQSVKSALYPGLRHCVQRRRRFVKYQHRRIFQEDPRYGNSLLLASRQQHAAFAHIGAESLRHVHYVIIDLGFFRSFDHLGIGGVRSAVSYIFHDGVREKIDILLHYADIPAQGMLRHLPDIVSVQAHYPAVRVVESRDQLAQSAFAPSRRPHDGNSLAGADMQIDPPQHAVLIIVRKVYSFHIDAALNTLQHHRMLGLPDLRPAAHQVDETVQTGEPVHEHFREIRQFPDRVDECPYIKVERYQIHIVHPVAHDEPAAHRHDHHRHDAHEVLQRRVELAESPVVVAFRGLESLIGYGKFSVVHVLVGECFGRPDAGKSRLDLAVDLRHLYLYIARGDHHVPAACYDHQQENRYDYQYHQRQSPLDREHYYQTADYGHDCYEKILRPVVRQFRQFEEVSGHAVHQLAGPVPVKEFEVHGLHVCEELLPHVRFNTHAEHMPPVGDDVVHSRPQYEGYGHDDHHREKCMVFLSRQQLVHGAPCHQRESQVYEARYESAGQIQQEQFPVGPEIPQESPHRRSAEISALPGGSLLIFRRHLFSGHAFRATANLRYAVFVCVAGACRRSIFVRDSTVGHGSTFFVSTTGPRYTSLLRFFIPDPGSLVFALFATGSRYTYLAWIAVSFSCPV